MYRNRGMVIPAVLVSMFVQLHQGVYRGYPLKKGRAMRNRAKLWLSYAALLVVLAVSMTGCSFDVSVPVLKELVLPGQSSLANASGLKTNAEGKIVLGPLSLGELCGFQNATTFQETVLTELEDSITGLPALFLGSMKITGVLLNEIEFAATTGDFSTLDRIVLELRADGESTGAFVAQNPDGFGASIGLVADPPYDLVADSGGNCIEPFYTVEGDIPPEDVVFDLILHLTIKYRVGLF